MGNDNDNGHDPDGVMPHALVTFTGRGIDPALEAIEYRVGPPGSFITLYPPPYDRQYIVLWGEYLTEADLRSLSDACHTLEREYADMSIYEDAREAERASSAFARADTWNLKENRQWAD